MKRCPTCSRTYTDDTLRFCLEDGTPLAAEAPATVPYGAPAAPVYAAPPAWTPTALPPRKRKVWPWVLGALLLIGLLGGGVIVAIIGLAAIGANSTNSNSANSNTANYNSNTSNVNRVVIEENTNSGSPTPTPPATNVKITRIYMAHDDGGKPGEETESFSPSDHTVHVVVRFDHAEEGTLVKFDWIAVDAGDMQEQSLKQLDYNTKALENIVHANLTLPHDWTEGDYKVDVYVNGQLARSVAFKIE
jgi:hypothetical protein